MGRTERGLPCPYHSPARSETLGQAFTLNARSCKAVARSLPVATCLCRGHVDARQLPALFVAGLAGRMPRELSQRAPFYEQGSPRALRGLRVLLRLLWPTSCQTRPSGGAQSSAPYCLQVPAMPQTVSYLADVRS